MTGEEPAEEVADMCIRNAARMRDLAAAWPLRCQWCGRAVKSAIAPFGDEFLVFCTDCYEFLDHLAVRLDGRRRA